MGLQLRPRRLETAAGQGQGPAKTRQYGYGFQQADKDTRCNERKDARLRPRRLQKAAEQGQGSASTRKFELLQAVTGLQGKGRSDNDPTSSSSRDKADAHMYDSIGVSCGSSLLDVSVRVCIYAVTVHMAHLFEWAWRFCSHVGNSLVVSLSQPLEEYALGLRMFICNALLSVRLHIQLCRLFLKWFCPKGAATFP